MARPQPGSPPDREVNQPAVRGSVLHGARALFMQLFLPSVRTGTAVGATGPRGMCGAAWPGSLSLWCPPEWLQSVLTRF